MKPTIAHEPPTPHYFLQHDFNAIDVRNTSAFTKLHIHVFIEKIRGAKIGECTFKRLHAFLILLPPTELFNYRFYSITIIFHFSHPVALWLNEKFGKRRIRKKKHCK